MDSRADEQPEEGIDRLICKIEAGYRLAAGIPGRPARFLSQRLFQDNPSIAAALAGLTAVISGLIAGWKADLNYFPELAVLVVVAMMSFIALFCISGRLWRGFDDTEADATGTFIERLALAIALIVMLIVLASVSSVNGLVAGFHEPGAASFNAEIATRPALPPGSAKLNEHLTDAIETWSLYLRPCGTDMDEDAEETRDACEEEQDAADSPATSAVQTQSKSPAPFPSYPDAPIRITGLIMAAESLLLIPAASIFLLILIIWGRRQTQQWMAVADPGNRLERLLGVSKWAAIAIWVAAILDLYENAVAIWVLADAWSSYHMQPSVALSFSTAILWILSLLTWIKMIAYLLGVAWICWFVWVALRHASQRAQHRSVAGGLWATVVTLRVSLGVIIVLAVGILLPSQTSEIFWRWSDTPMHMFAGLLMAILLAAFLYYVSVWQIDRARAADERDDLNQSETKRRAYYFGFIIAGAAVALAIPSYLDDTYKPLLGIGLVLAIAIAGLPIKRDAETPSAVRSGLAATTLPFFIASGVLALMFVGLLQAAGEMLPFFWLRGTPVSYTRSSGLLCPCIVLLLLLLALSWFWADRSKILPTDRGLVQKTMRSQERLHPAYVFGASALAWLVIGLSLRSESILFGLTAAVGPTLVVLLFLMLSAGTLIGLVELIDWFLPRPSRALALLRFRRTPVILILLAWLLLGSYLPAGSNENLYTLDYDQPGSADQRNFEPRTGESLEAAFNEWRWQNCLLQPDQAVGDVAEKPVVPLILVATSGGGLRAAAWTTYVMDRAIGYSSVPDQSCNDQPSGERAPTQLMFAASGISGGSVGLATWAAHFLGDKPTRDTASCPPTSSDKTASIEAYADCPDRDGKPATGEWIADGLGADMLSPQLSWLFFVEFPWSFVRVGLSQSRDAVLDHSWERAWDLEDSPPSLFGLRTDESQWEADWQKLSADGLSGDDIRKLYDLADERKPGDADIPLLIFNGTSAENGCRFNGSVLAGNARDRDAEPSGCRQPTDISTSSATVLPATNDLVDFLCSDQDVPLSTISVLTARFPILLPAGHLRQCKPDGEEHTETWVIDGGYLESAGAATVVDLWTALEPLITQHNRDPRAPAYIVPVMIQIDNGHLDPVGPDDSPAPPQFLAPVNGVIASRNGNNALNRQSAQVIFSQPYTLYFDDAGQPVTWCHQRYVNFSLLAHPGPQARLGWLLSEVGFEDLISQMEAAPDALRLIDRWNDGLPASAADSLDDAACSGR